MGVCRGKISEGLDFSDKAARCVILVGIPYPMMVDPKTILKKDYLDRKHAKMGGVGLRGQDWYCQQATRAVNQAMGRVIRHVQDYGSIILMDERYANYGNKMGISKWLRDKVREFVEFDPLEQQLAEFFKKMDEMHFKPKVEKLKEVQLDLGEEEKIDVSKQSEGESEEEKLDLAPVKKANPI